MSSDKPQATPKRILVVEDDRDTAESLREVLEFEGYQVFVTTSGPEALSITSRFHPDVVLCDIGLPGMSGYEIARRMRQDPTLADTRLVALSGHARPEDVAMSKHAGFDVHLAKPALLDDLVAVIRRSPMR